MISSPLSNIISNPLAGIVFILAIVLAISVHECAHAWTAWKLGDQTPLLDGRVTLNPASHIDPIGALLFLFLGFGYGRPVVYNPMRLHRKIDELLVALAGPASNILLALIFNIFIAIEIHTGTNFIDTSILGLVVLVNLSLAAFNMIPIPPLDGSSIVAYFWPEYRSIVGGQLGIVFLLLILILPGNFLGSIINPIINTFSWISTLFGLIH